MKLTDWFGPKDKPTIAGVYETDAYENITSYQHWDGERWGYYASTLQRAESDKFMKSSHQNARWRGLAEDPSKTA